MRQVLQPRVDPQCLQVVDEGQQDPVEGLAVVKEVDVQKLADACTDKWYNQTLCKVNDSVVRMAVVQGEYHWHEHNDIDEFFFVLDGRFLIDLEDRGADLLDRQVELVE